MIFIRFPMLKTIVRMLTVSQGRFHVHGQLYVVVMQMDAQSPATVDMSYINYDVEQSGTAQNNVWAHCKPVSSARAPMYPVYGIWLLYVTTSTSRWWSKSIGYGNSSSATNCSCRGTRDMNNSVRSISSHLIAVRIVAGGDSKDLVLQIIAIYLATKARPS